MSLRDATSTRENSVRECAKKNLWFLENHWQENELKGKISDGN